MNFPKKEIESLWAPWRVEYFERKEPLTNFLEAAAMASDDAAHLVVHRGKYAFVLMNQYPYATGHLMVCPYRTVADLADLGEEEVLEIWRFAALSEQVLRQTIRAQGFNIGLNIGTAAGAGLATHLHLHVVPRWEGDSNFMATIGHTRIIPEALAPLYDKLREAFAAASSCAG